MKRRTFLGLAALAGLVSTTTLIAPHDAVAADKKWKIGFSQATTIEPWRAQFNKDIIAEAVKHPEVDLILVQVELLERRFRRAARGLVVINGHASVPLFMSSAVMRPYGGLINGSPCTFGPPPPPSPPPPPPPAAPRPPAACTGDPASERVDPPRPPPLVALVAGAPRPPAPPAALGTAFGSRAVPWTQSKSDFVGSGLTRPSAVGAVLVKM